MTRLEQIEDLYEDVVEGEIVEPRYRAVRALLIDTVGNGLLLTRSRNDENRRGEGDLPGGGVDDGETMERAVIRETLEETGLQLVHSELELVFNKVARRIGEPEAIINWQLFRTSVYHGDIRLSVEHESYSWQPLEVIKNRIQHPVWSVAVKYAIDQDLL